MSAPKKWITALLGIVLLTAVLTACGSSSSDSTSASTSSTESTEAAGGGEGETQEASGEESRNYCTDIRDLLLSDRCRLYRSSDGFDP